MRSWCGARREHLGQWPKADYKAPRRALTAILDTLDLVCCAVPYAFDFVHADATSIVAGVAKKAKLLRLCGPGTPRGGRSPTLP